MNALQHMLRSFQDENRAHVLLQLQQMQLQLQQQQVANEHNNNSGHRMLTSGMETSDVAMELSPLERQLSIDLKQALQQEDDMTRISDMLIAQVVLMELQRLRNSLGSEAAAAAAAVIPGEREAILASGMERIRLLQTIKEEYEIHDTLDEARDVLRKCFDQHLNMVLAVDYDPFKDHFVVIYDSAAFRPSAMDELRTVIVSAYYTFHCMCPNFHSIRAGVVHLGETSDVGWRNVNPNIYKQIWSDILIPYPIYHRAVLWLNSSMIANLAYSFIKPVLPEDVKKRFVLGSRLDGYSGRIDQLFKQPTPEVASALTLMKIGQFLATRITNEENFRL